MILETAVVCLALNVYYEARGEPLIGQIAVGLVTMRRANHEWEKLCEVVYEPKQFSWTWDGEQGAPLSPVALDRASSVARFVMSLTPETARALYGEFATADHYHADYILPPIWTHDMERVGQIGRHIFYRSK